MVVTCVGGVSFEMRATDTIESVHVAYRASTHHQAFVALRTDSLSSSISSVKLQVWFEVG